MNLDHLLTPHTRINSTWIKCRTKPIKIVEENVGSIGSKSQTLLIAIFYQIQKKKINK